MAKTRTDLPGSEDEWFFATWLHLDDQPDPCPTFHSIAVMMLADIPLGWPAAVALPDYDTALAVAAFLFANPNTISQLCPYCRAYPYGPRAIRFNHSREQHSYDVPACAFAGVPGDVRWEPLLWPPYYRY